VLDDPQGCHPRWCLTESVGPACAATDTSCGPTARACTAQEIAAGKGCLAGQYPDSSGTCRPAGLWADDALRSAPAVPELGDLDLAYPQPGPLPPADETWFCGAHDGQLPRLCRSVDPDCTATPTPTGCVRAGVPWVCPPGFLPQGPLSPSSGLAACQPDAADCGSAPYPTVSGPKVLYVDPKAPPGGDGTQAKPWSSLQVAANTAPQGATLLLAAGDHKIPALPIKKGLTIAGRCAAMVRIVGQGPDPALYALGGGGSVTVRGVTIQSPKPGLAALAGGQATAERVFFAQVGEIGAVAHGPGSHLELRQSVVDGTQAVNVLGLGAAAQAGAALELYEVRLRGNLRAGVQVRDQASKLTAQRLRIDGTRPLPTGPDDCTGLLVELGGTAVIDAAALVDNLGYGVAVRMGAANAELQRTVVARTRHAPGDAASTAAIGVHNGRLTAAALRVTDNERVGLVLGGPQTDVQVHAGIVDHSVPGAESMAFGALVAQGAHVQLSEVRLSHHRDSAIWTADAETRLALDHALLDSTRATNAKADFSGCALNVRFSSQATVDWVRATDTDDCGVGADGPDSRIDGAHLVVDHVVGRPVPGSGRGIALIGSHSALHEVRVIDTTGMAVSVSHGGGLVVDRLLVARVRPIDGSAMGIGVGAHDQGRARIHRARVSDVVGIGTLVDLSGVMHMSDTLVDGGASQGWPAFGSLSQRGGQLRAVGVRWLGNERATAGVTGASFLSVSRALSRGFAPLDPRRALGIAAGLGPFVSVSHTRLEGCAGTALSALNDVVLQVTDLAIAGVVAEKSLSRTTAMGKHGVEVADALLVSGSGSATLARVVATGYKRAGAALMAPPPGSMHHSVFVGGYFGIVVPQQTDVFAQFGNAAWGNTENRNFGSKLDLPPAPKVVDLDL